MLICAIWSHLKLTVRNSTVENRLEFFDNSNLTLSRVPWFNLIAHSRGQKNSYFSTLLSLSLRDSTSFLIRVKKRFHFFQTEFTRALWTRRRKLGRIVCRSGGGGRKREKGRKKAEASCGNHHGRINCRLIIFGIIIRRCASRTSQLLAIQTTIRFDSFRSFPPPLAGGALRVVSTEWGGTKNSDGRKQWTRL